MRSDSEPSPALHAFVMRLGAAMSAAGEPVYAVQERLTRVASAYGVDQARVTAFPTFLMVAMGRSEPATLEITVAPPVPRLDQIAAVDRLARAAEHGSVAPTDGLRLLDDIA